MNLVNLENVEKSCQRLSAPMINRSMFSTCNRRDGVKKTLKEHEDEFVTITDATGGTVCLPASAAEMIDQAAGVARNVDSQYMVSYKPLRPLGSSTAKEYRRIDVFSRRVGLNVSARRGYVVK